MILLSCKTTVVSSFLYSEKIDVSAPAPTAAAILGCFIAGAPRSARAVATRPSNSSFPSSSTTLAAVAATPLLTSVASYQPMRANVEPYHSYADDLAASVAAAGPTILSLSTNALAAAAWILATAPTVLKFTPVLRVRFLNTFETSAVMPWIDLGSSLPAMSVLRKYLSMRFLSTHSIEPVFANAIYFSTVIVERLGRSSSK